MTIDVTGTGTLLRLAWRRDRVLIPVSVALLSALSIGSAQATIALYPTEESAQAGLGGILANPAISAMYGPVVTNRDGLSVFKTVMMGAVFVGILANALVRRHTRVEEEEGRLELLGAGVVGRQAPLTAAVLLAVLTTAVTSVISTAGLAALGLDPLGSLAFGVSWAIAGFVMTGVAAVAGQLTTSARAASGIGYGVLGVMFLMRAVGDTDSSARVLTWISPMGWVGEVRPYGDNRIWLILPALAVLGVGLGVAYSLLGRRDLGAGLIAARPGPGGSTSLRSPLSLAWRIDRATVVGWSAAFLVLAVVIGSLATSVAAMASDPQVSDMLAKMGGSVGTITDIYLATELRFAAAGAAAAGIVLVVRMASEERLGRTEQVLSTAASRAGVYAARLLLGLAFPALLLTIMGVVTGALAARAGADVGVGAMVQAAWATLPAAWLIVGVALGAYGLGYRLTAAVGWGVLTIALVLGEFGPLLSLPKALIDLSPFTHLSPLPGGTFASGSALTMVAVAAVVVGGGLVAFRRRDIG